MLLIRTRDRIFKVAVFFVAAFFLVITQSGCSFLSANEEGTKPSNANQDELWAESTVVVRNPSFHPATGERVFWEDSITWVGVPETPRAKSWSVFIQETLNQEFQRKGLQVVSSTGDYKVLAFVIMGELSSQPALEELFRLYPDVGSSAVGRERGTLILALVPETPDAAPSNDTAWRGAIQVFRDLDGELDDQRSHARIKTAIQLLMQAFPEPS